MRTTGGTAAKAGGTDTSCIGSERERQALSRGLASVKRRCEAADANATEAAATLPLLAINADMVARLPLCTNAGATTAGGGACLDLQHTAGIYWLSNAACGDRTMIGVVEIRLSTGIVKCRGHVVAKPVKLGTSKPTINFECARNSTDCTVPSVRAMFPWCAW